MSGGLAYRCRCGHEWVPRVYKAGERPRVCPDCKSPQLGQAVPLAAAEAEGVAPAGSAEGWERDLLGADVAPGAFAHPLEVRGPAQHGGHRLVGGSRRRIEPGVRHSMAGLIRPQYPAVRCGHLGAHGTNRLLGGVKDRLSCRRVEATCARSFRTMSSSARVTRIQVSRSVSALRPVQASTRVVPTPRSRTSQWHHQVNCPSNPQTLALRAEHQALRLGAPS